jgi:hypothetical protein
LSRGEGKNVQKAEDRSNAGKDKMTITIHGYSLSKKVRHAIMKKLTDEVERCPDRLIADARKKSKRRSDKKLPGHQRASKTFEEVGD